MKLSKLITGLLLTVSCFSVSAQSACSSEEIKLKPVYMNGMFNDFKKANESAELMSTRLQSLYGEDIVKGPGDYYLAYNDSEFLLTQLSEVAFQFFIHSMYADDAKYSEDEKERYIAEYKLALLSLDIDAIKHVVDISSILADGYKLVITSHSQGNIYLNILFIELLQYYPDKYRVIAVLS